MQRSLENLAALFLCAVVCREKGAEKITRTTNTKHQETNALVAALKCTKKHSPSHALTPLALPLTPPHIYTHTHTQAPTNQPTKPSQNNHPHSFTSSAFFTFFTSFHEAAAIATRLEKK
jgi:hypothetical protein